MKSLPLSERPYEKCLNLGPDHLSDSELLAVILRSGSAGQSALSLARTILARFGERGGLSCLMDLTAKELRGLPGIGPVKAVELLAVAELSRRIVRTSRKTAVSLGDPASIAAYFMEELCYRSREEIRVAMFDAKNKLLHELILSQGTVNASLASPRELFREALRHGAVYLVLLHNHPSGDPSPSEADIQMTRQMVRAGELMQIPVMDHIIIGDHCYVSLREEGLLIPGP